MQNNSIPIDDCHPKVNVRRLVFSDWNNYAEAAIQERERILNADLPGCWYINPMFCVHSPEPTNEFFEEINKRHGSWFRDLSRHFGKGWKTLRRQARSPLKRGEEFEGVLVLAGQLVLSEDISEIRQVLGQLPTVSYRRQAFLLLQYREIHALAELANGELNRCRSADRSQHGDAYFILPHVTVQNSIDNDAFYAEADRRNGEWHRAVNRLFHKRERREFNRHIGDLRTLMPKGRFLIAGESKPLDLLRSRGRESFPSHSRRPS